MLIRCSHCGQGYDVQESAEGEIITCQKCSSNIRLPEIRSGYQIIPKQKKFVVTKPSKMTVAKTPFDSLIRCPACSQNVSKNAVSCPHCGHPLQEKEEPGGMLLGFLFGILGLLIAAVVWGIGGVRKAFIGMLIHFGILFILHILFGSLV